MVTGHHSDFEDPWEFLRMIEKFHCVFGPPIALGLSPKFDITLKVIQGFVGLLGSI